MYTKLCRDLIRDGTDQCRAALKRFSSKTHYRQCANDMMNKKEWKKRVESMDINFITLDNEIEAVVNQSKVLLREVTDALSQDRMIDNERGLSFDENEGNETDYLLRLPDSLSSKALEIHPHANIHQGLKQHIMLDHGHFKSRKKTQRKKAIASCQKDEISNTRGIEGRGELLMNNSKPSRNSQRVNASAGFYNELDGSNTNNRESEQNDIGIQAQFLQLTEETMFKELLDKNDPQQFNDAVDDDHSCSSTISELCDKLSLVYPKNEKRESIVLLRQLGDLISNPHILQGNAHYISVLVFETIFQLCKRNGSVSIQEMIQTRNDGVITHVELLICVMKLLSLNLQNHLKDSDGIIYNIFSTSAKESIVDFTILQLVDVLYSQLLPTAWGQPVEIPPNVFVTLKRLRDEIGKVVHITETASRILCKEMKEQKWQKSKFLERTWFVSSISADYAASYWSENSSIQGMFLM